MSAVLLTLKEKLTVLNNRYRPRLLFKTAALPGTSYVLSNSKTYFDSPLSLIGGEQERKNLTHVSKVNVTDTTKHYLESYEENYKSSCQFGLLANLFCSEGKRGDVIEVRAKTRTGNLGCSTTTLRLYLYLTFYADIFA